MELVQHKIAVPKGTKEIILAPLGDIQWAGRKHELSWSALREYVADAMARKAWFIGMGDYVDFASPSNRQRLRSAALYDTAERVIDDKARDLCDELLAELLAPTKGRWLGMLEGHHWTHLQTGETTDQYLCQKLLAPFLGTCAYLGLVFQTHHGTRTVAIWAHHGQGGGGKSHAPILKLENLAGAWEADIMLIGHMNKQASSVLQRCYPEWASKLPVIRHKEIHLVGCGGWLKGYPERNRQGSTPRGNYIEQKMLTPVALGSPTIRIRPQIRSKFAADTVARYWEPKITVEL